MSLRFFFKYERDLPCGHNPKVLPFHSTVNLKYGLKTSDFKN